MSLTAYAFVPDEELRDTIARLEDLVLSLRLSDTAIGLRLFQQYSDALDAARAELLRRAA